MSFPIDIPIEFVYVLAAVFWIAVLPEPVKSDETRGHVMLCPSTSLGLLIQAGPGRAGGVGWPVDEALGMGGVGGIEDVGPSFPHLTSGAEVDRGRGVIADARVTVVMVVVVWKKSSAKARAS